MGVDAARGHPPGKRAEPGSIPDSPSTQTHGKRKLPGGSVSRGLEKEKKKKKKQLLSLIWEKVKK